MNDNMIDRVEAAKIIRKAAKAIESNLGVMPKIYIDHINQMVKEIRQ